MLTEDQLQAWSRQGDVSVAYETYQSIKRVLNAGYPLRDRDFEVYLQGSYQNDTNVCGYPDVDIVVQLNQTFLADTQGLHPNELPQYLNNYGDANYTFEDFWFEIVETLNRLTTASTLTYGYKSVKIYNHTNGLSANLRIGLQYRKYKSFQGVGSQKFIEGVKFYAHSQGNWATSYPKLHYVHGCIKNLPGQTNGWFTPTVRMFKNARNNMVDNRKIAVNVAPSYFIECLLYNMPNEVYGVNHQTTFKNILDWLNKQDKAKFEAFTAQNGQELLFGDSPVQWRIGSATSFVDALTGLL